MVGIDVDRKSQEGNVQFIQVENQHSHQSKWEKLGMRRKRLFSMFYKLYMYILYFLTSLINILQEIWMVSFRCDSQLFRFDFNRYKKALMTQRDDKKTHTNISLIKLDGLLCVGYRALLVSHESKPIKAFRLLHWGGSYTRIA